MNERYIVELRDDERERLCALVAAGARLARTVKRAQILLAAHGGDRGSKRLPESKRHLAPLRQLTSSHDHDVVVPSRKAERCPWVSVCSRAQRALRDWPRYQVELVQTGLRRASRPHVRLVPSSGHVTRRRSRGGSLLQRKGRVTPREGRRQPGVEPVGSVRPRSRRARTPRPRRRGRAPSRARSRPAPALEGECPRAARRRPHSARRARRRGRR